LDDVVTILTVMRGKTQHQGVQDQLSLCIRRVREQIEADRKADREVDAYWRSWAQREAAVDEKLRSLAGAVGAKEGAGMVEVLDGALAAVETLCALAGGEGEA
jgi:hypothetical protein